jgi:hypothetical protein
MGCFTFIHSAVAHWHHELQRTIVAPAGSVQPSTPSSLRHALDNTTAVNATGLAALISQAAVHTTYWSTAKEHHNVRALEQMFAARMPSTSALPAERNL